MADWVDKLTPGQVLEGVAKRDKGRRIKLQGHVHVDGRLAQWRVVDQSTKQTSNITIEGLRASWKPAKSTD